MAASNTAIRHGDNPLVLTGDALGVGAPAPDARLVELTSGGMEEVRVRDLLGRVVLFSVVPSVDTSTCHAQTRYLADALRAFGGAVTACTVSVDLPFAQRRWLEAESCTSMRMLSDYRYREFGLGYGTYIEKYGFLTRALFIIDRGGIVRYVDYVDNISDEPRYEGVVGALRAVVTR